MSTTNDPTLEPGELIDANGNYYLQHKDIYALLRYIWTGVLLPQDLESFKIRVHLQEKDFDAKLQPGITKLLENYRTISKNCKQFKDVTYPSIVSLASDVKSYAQDVGGDIETSYYPVVLQLCTQLDEEQKKPHPDEQTIITLKDEINEIVNQQIKAIDDLLTKAETATQNLRDFEESCKQDKNDLSLTKSDLDEVLKGPGGEITTLENQINGLRQELIDDQKEYDHGMFTLYEPDISLT